MLRLAAVSPFTTMHPAPFPVPIDTKLVHFDLYLGRAHVATNTSELTGVAGPYIAVPDPFMT